jgi:hypothetical protein
MKNEFNKEKKRKDSYELRIDEVKHFVSLQSISPAPDINDILSKQRYGLLAFHIIALVHPVETDYHHIKAR